MLFLNIYVICACVVLVCLMSLDSLTWHCICWWEVWASQRDCLAYWFVWMTHILTYRAVIFSHIAKEEGKVQLWVCGLGIKFWWFSPGTSLTTNAAFIRDNMLIWVGKLSCGMTCSRWSRPRDHMHEAQIFLIAESLLLRPQANIVHGFKCSAWHLHSFN